MKLKLCLLKKNKKKNKKKEVLINDNESEIAKDLNKSFPKIIEKINNIREEIKRELRS